MSAFSEEDEPAIYEDSGSEWSEGDSSKKRKNNRRSTRAVKKRRSKATSSSSEEISSEDEKPKKKNGVNTKRSPQKPITHDESSSASGRNSAAGGPINTKEYSTGSFLISKKDARKGDAKEKACIWRVDGKALLQKYEPFEDEGNMRHRSTSVYTGWSALDKESYAPIKVTIKRQNNQSTVVEVDWVKIKEEISD